jgi:hypothetical protein
LTSLYALALHPPLPLDLILSTPHSHCHYGIPSHFIHPPLHFKLNSPHSISPLPNAQVPTNVPVCYNFEIQSPFFHSVANCNLHQLLIHSYQFSLHKLFDSPAGKLFGFVRLLNCNNLWDLSDCELKHKLLQFNSLTNPNNFPAGVRWTFSMTSSSSNCLLGILFFSR